MARRVGRRTGGAAALAVVALAPLTGCSVINAYEDPLAVGDWEAKDSIGDERNTMALELDGDGEADLHFLINPDPTVHTESFDISWEQSGSDSFELDMECQSSTLLGNSCGDADFTMDCDVKGGGDRLECEGDKTWETYAFEWERD